MNKKEFLEQLKRGLDKLPKMEKYDILRDYEEHFFAGLENNLTESEISESLGNPSQIANDILANYNIKKTNEQAHSVNVFRGTIAAISLILFNLIFVLGPVISVFAILIAGWVTAISLLLSFLIVIISMVVSPGHYFLFEFFISLGAVSLGIFTLFATNWLTKKFIYGLTLYVRKNIEIIVGGKKI